MGDLIKSITMFRHRAYWYSKNGVIAVCIEGLKVFVELPNKTREFTARCYKTPRKGALRVTCYLGYGSRGTFEVVVGETDECKLVVVRLGLWDWLPADSYIVVTEERRSFIEWLKWW